MCISFGLVKLDRISVWLDFCEGLKEKEKNEKLERRNGEIILPALN